MSACEEEADFLGSFQFAQALNCKKPEINHQIFIKGFDYVVEIKTGERICFGSTIPRNTAPIGKGLSPFQKLNARELFPHGPGTYHPEKFISALDAVLNKVTD